MADDEEDPVEAKRTLTVVFLAWGFLIFGLILTVVIWWLATS
jgi:hypothetical protein